MNRTLRSLSRRLGFLALALALSLGACAASCPLDDQTLDAIRNLADAHIEADIAPGIVLAIRCGDAYWIEPFGLSLIKTQEPMDSSLQFFVGSISKQFVAAAILRLRESGVLDLDDPISNFIDQVPDDWAVITIRHLLTHTSGANSFGGYTQLPFDAGGVWPSESVISAMMTGDLAFVPGEEYCYSRTTGYMILAFVVERVAGVTLETYIEREFLAPLKLSGTGFATVHEPTKLTGFYHHYWNGQAMFEEVPHFDTALGSAMYSTAADLLAWQIALSTGQVISKDSYTMMTTRATTCSADGVTETHDYGLGLEVIVNEDDSLAELGHRGHGGHRASLWVYPAADIVVAVLQNCDRPLRPLLEDIEAVLFPPAPSD